jgi:hypothetical protein
MLRFPQSSTISFSEKKFLQMKPHLFQVVRTRGQYFHKTHVARWIPRNECPASVGLIPLNLMDGRRAPAIFQLRI